MPDTGTHADLIAEARREKYRFALDAERYIVSLADALEAAGRREAGLERELEALGRGRTFAPENLALQGELLRTRGQLAQAQKALEFYAQQYGVGARLASDGGKLAREALAAMDRSEP